MTVKIVIYDLDLDLDWGFGGFYFTLVFGYLGFAGFRDIRTWGFRKSEI